jgi:hypothetical protein
MKKILISLFSFLFLQATAQRTISGRVVTSEQGTPVPGCSVFISNSSIGVATNKEGRFELTNVPPGRHELVVSSVGYETAVYPFASEQLPLKLKFELKIKVKELPNVLVEPYAEEGWEKWGKLFFSAFIGTDKNAGHCKIKNTEKIKFRYYKKSGRVVANCDEPVIIENKALGYLIKYQLEEFQQDNTKKTLFFFGYPLFEDLSAGEKRIKPKWEKERLEAYNGSIVHFMACLYKNTLAEEGFAVKRMSRYRNEEKDRIRRLIQQAIAQKKDSLVIVNVEKHYLLYGQPQDSGIYYQRIMRQSDFIDKYETQLLTADSISFRCDSGSFKCLSFNNYLSITYKKEKEDPLYLASTGINRPLSYQHSLVTLINNKVVFFNKTGSYYMPQDFFTEGYWGWGEKISTLLPIDYTLPPG